jgi:hypothetical protein
VQIGYAWLLAQTDNRAAARDSLRAVIKAATGLSQGGARDRGRFGFTMSLAAEAATYLIPLLSAASDRNELARLNQLIEDDRKVPRAVTPIAIPLRDSLTAADLEQRSARVLRRRRLGPAGALELDHLTPRGWCMIRRAPDASHQRCSSSAA